MSNENRHIDIIEMDAASSRKIDDIRDVIEQTKYRPSIAKYKIFIIDEVHMLTREAFNALLKTLEEPPSYVKFILATTDPLKLPATILSRTQHFRFKKISSKDVVHHLTHIINQENTLLQQVEKSIIDFEIEALEMLSRAGSGSLRDTITLLDQAIIFTKSTLSATNVSSMLGLVDPNYISTIFDTLFALDKKEILQIIKELEAYECEVVIDEFIAYLKERFFDHDVRFNALICERFFKILSEAKNHLFLNADSGFVLTLLFFKMMEATKLKDLNEMIEELEVEIENHTPSKILGKSHESFEIKEVITAPKKQKVDRYDILIKAMYDRNYELGECFAKNVSFVSYAESTLTLVSSATDECKEMLRKRYAIVKQIIFDTYGVGTNIIVEQAPAKEETAASVVPQQEHNHEGENTESCLSAEISEGKEEIDKVAITEHPLVQKAQELFNPKEIRVREKI
jgi:DNA polymerase-3 subunit gamma/tau